MKRTTIVVGDVHGCLVELERLLDDVSFLPGADRLIFVGDLVDRGPDSAGVVRLARRLRAEAVRGNHEEKHLRFARHESRKRDDPRYKNPMRFSEHKLAVHASLDADDLEWLRGLPLHLRISPRWAVVHAGLNPHRPLDDQDPDVIVRARNVVPESGQMISLGKDINEPSEGRFWAELWPGPESVVYGHNVYSLESPRVDLCLPGVECLGIDTGCCFGGRLTAAVFDGDDPQYTLSQVPAAREYWPRRRYDP